MVIIAGLENPWSARRKIDPAHLLGEPWTLSEPDNVAASFIADTFRLARLKPPKPQFVSNSVAVRMRLVETGKFLSVVPASMLHFGAQQLRVKILPVKLPEISWPVEITTMKNRMLSPTANLFIRCAREVAKSVPDLAQARRSRQKS